jgi:hypothetical protein
MAALCALAFAGDQYANLSFMVVKDTNGKPVRNASVILHEVDKHGHQAKGGLQIKTDGEGKARYEGVPFGKLRIQVIAHGFQTFGNDYDITKPEMEIAIRMKPPADQVTIYGDNKDQKKDEQKPAEQKPPDQPKTDEQKPK